MYSIEEQRSNFIRNVCSFKSAEMREACYRLLLVVWNDEHKCRARRSSHPLKLSMVSAVTSSALTPNFHCTAAPHRSASGMHPVGSGLHDGPSSSRFTALQRCWQWNLASTECKDHGRYGGCIIII